RSPVRGPARRRDHHRRWPHVLPGPLARADRRALPARGRPHPLRKPMPTREPSLAVVPTRPVPPTVPPVPPVASSGSPRSLFDRAILARAVVDAIRKLDPRTLTRNPVMFVVEVVAAITTVFLVRDLAQARATTAFVGQIAAWLWFTVLFANFAEAVA